MNGRHQIRMVWGISCLWVILPCVGYGADLTIGNNVSTIGTISATSFTGNGSGLTNLDPAKLSSGTANINISGNASTVTNGLYSSGGYADPPWITSLSPGKLSSGTANINITGNAANATTAGTANSVSAGAVQNGGLANNAVNPQNIAFYSNVAIVAPILVSSGYNYFNNPATAMSNYATWCGTPSETNRCLLKIMPGVYTVTAPVVMRSYVDIEGSGENTTVISSGISSGTLPPPGTVQGASNAELRFLSVENKGIGMYTAAIFNSGASVSILHVTATGENGDSSYGIYNENLSHPKMTNVIAYAFGITKSYCIYNNNSSSPVMTNVTVYVHRTGNNYGVYNNSQSSPTMINVTVDIGGMADNYGIYNNNSSPVIMNLTMSAGGGLVYGIYNEGNSSPAITNVIVSIGGGYLNYGIYNKDSSSPTLSNVAVTIDGGSSSDNYGVYNTSASPTITNVTLLVSGNGGTDYGVYNTFSSPSMTNVTVSASGGDDNYGVYNIGGAPILRDVLASATGGSGMNAAIRNDNNSNTFLSNVTANASGGTYAFGLFNINTAGPVDVNRSTFSASGATGDYRGIRNDSASMVKVGASKISGTAAGNLTCIYCYNGNYAALSSSCQ